MDLERAFLDDVIERPEDDAPRLVYADWLEDKGDPDRAEFIRLQCRLAAMDAGDPARPALRRRETELLAAHAVRWAEPLRGLMSFWSFRRGFIDFVTLDRIHDTDLGVLPEIFRLVPLEALDLQEYGADAIPALLALRDQLPRLVRLELFGLDDAAAGDVARLLTAPGLANLRTLYIDQEYASEFPAQALAILGKSPALSRLTTLGLVVGDEAGDLPAGVVRAIARSPYLRLQRLYLVNTELASPLRPAELRLPAMQGLTTLSLESSAVGGVMWEELLRAESFPNLAELRLSRVGIEDAMRRALVARLGEDKVFIDALSDGTFFPKRECHHWPSP